MAEYIGEVAPDTLIQRYMDLPKFMAMLTSGQLFFSSISSFPDKLEGTLPALNEMIAGNAAAIFDMAVNICLPTVQPLTNSQRVHRDELLSNFERATRNRTIESVFGELSVEQGEKISSVVTRQKNWLDVSCWHKGQSAESLAMWKVYGASKNSVCLSASLAGVCESLTARSGHTIAVAEVEYIDPETDVFKSTHPLGAFSHKHKFYAYEQELRFFHYQPSADPMSDRAVQGTGVNLDIGSAIREIIISPEADEWFFDMITKLVNDIFKLDVDVRRSKMTGLMS